MTPDRILYFFECEETEVDVSMTTIIEFIWTYLVEIEPFSLFSSLASKYLIFPISYELMDFPKR